MSHLPFSCTRRGPGSSRDKAGQTFAALRGAGLVVCAVILVAGGCILDRPEPPVEKAYNWSAVAEVPGSALTSVYGTSARNVFAVGADAGRGPVVVHWDGASWNQLDTGTRGDLWWVHAVDDVVFMAGANSNILKYEDGVFERMSTPGFGSTIVYGIWSSSSRDVYAVGSRSGRNGFIWHYDGTTWNEVDLPGDQPQDENHDVPQLFKVWGTAPDDVWICGERGVVLRGNAADGFALIPTPSESRLFTVHGIPGQIVAVGGALNGVVLTLEEDVEESTLGSSQLLQGVWVTPQGEVWATGSDGQVYRKGTGGFELQITGITRPIQSLHAVWVDEDDGVWAVGGNVLSSPLSQGTLLYGHPTLPAPQAVRVDNPSEVIDNECPESAIDIDPQGSIARRWNEQLLNAVRRDLPRPTVHARNLFHLSAAMWDVWAAYDDRATGYLVTEKHAAADVAKAREEAISYASYRLLSHRYGPAIGGERSVNCFTAFMEVLGYDPAVTSTEGDTPQAFGNRVGKAYVDAFAEDGANEANNYADPDGFTAPTPRLTVDRPGSNTDDPTQWQQIILAQAVTQNGIPEGSGVRAYIGAHWGNVPPFALVRSGEGEPYFQLDAPTTLDADLLDATVDVIRKSSELDADDGVMLDISPGAYGNNPLGTNDGHGHEVNPATGQAYAPEVVRRGDFTRLLSEFWADGPASETPPGHWNTLANELGDYPGFQRRLFGTGEELDPLSWDVHVYFAMNGALHDAAIAAWELKRTYLTARPITLIRTLAARGQRSDPEGPSYNPDGLPLVENLIEVITEESSAKGERHAHLARYVGEIAVRSWRGEPGDRKAEVSGVGWIRGIEWLPYQRRTFVTPEFPGFVSGHSTFSRSAAEVLTELTGSPYFPGGIGGYTLAPGWLTFEKGPTASVELRWATYYDAADQAGQSRLWGGIHVVQDDFGGRRIGSEIGMRAVELARTHFGDDAGGD